MQQRAEVVPSNEAEVVKYEHDPKPTPVQRPTGKGAAPPLRKGAQSNDPLCIDVNLPWDYGRAS